MDGSLPDIVDYLSCPEDVVANYSFADAILTDNSDKTNGTFCQVSNELFSAGGDSINDVYTFFGFFDPPNLCPNIMYCLSTSLKYFLTPLPPLCGRHIWKRPRKKSRRGARLALRHCWIPGHGSLREDGGIARRHVLHLLGGQDGVPVVHKRHLFSDGRDLTEARIQDRVKSQDPTDLFFRLAKEHNSDYSKAGHFFGWID